MRSPTLNSLFPHDQFEIEALADWRIETTSLDNHRLDDAVSWQSLSGEFPATRLIDDQTVQLVFSGLVSIEVSLKNQSVSVAVIDPEASDDDLHHILYDHVAPRLISLDNLVLHGAAVAIGEAIAIFIGDTGAGKSTLSASMSQAGHTLLGDDAVIVSAAHSAPLGQAVYPSLRLLPESIDALYDDPIQTSPMARYSAKRRLDIAQQRSGITWQLPIAAVFHLQTNRQALAPKLEQLAPANACLTMMAQSFALNPTDPAAAQDRLAQLAQLTSQIPVYALDYPREFSALAQVHELIVAEVA